MYPVLCKVKEEIFKDFLKIPQTRVESFYFKRHNALTKWLFTILRLVVICLTKTMTKRIQSPRTKGPSVMLKVLSVTQSFGDVMLRNWFDDSLLIITLVLAATEQNYRCSNPDVTRQPKSLAKLNTGIIFRD